MKTPMSDYALGTGLATDLINTAPTGRSSGEALTSPTALGRFLVEHGVEPHAMLAAPRLTTDDLDEVRSLRKELRSLVLAGDEISVVTGATELLTRAGTVPTLLRDSAGRWQWHLCTARGAPLADELGAFAAAGFLGVLRALGHARFRSCVSPVCDGVFVDTSKAGRRRYCMPALCGNRLNVANHRARKVTGEEPA